MGVSAWGGEYRRLPGLQCPEFMVCVVSLHLLNPALHRSAFTTIWVLCSSHSASSVLVSTPATALKTDPDCFSALPIITVSLRSSVLSTQASSLPGLKRGLVTG